MKHHLLLLLLSTSLVGRAQQFYSLRGYVYTDTNEPLVGATVRVVNASTGTITDVSGKYELKVLEGLNRLSVSLVGYKTELLDLVIEKDLVQHFYLKIDQKQLDEVVVKVKKKDYSYEVIKNVIDNKSTVLNQYQNFKSKVYIKSVETKETKTIPKKNDDSPKSTEEQLRETQQKPTSAKDSLPNLNIFECQLTRHESSLGQQKEEREAVKKIGDQSTLFFKSVTDGEFNLYKNLQKIAKIGDNQFTSPISDLTFLAYKFQLIKYFFEGSDKIYLIKVIPRDLGNALYEGTIEVLEDQWVLRSVDLKLTKRGLMRYDEFGFKQTYEHIQNRWVPTKTVYEWKVKEGNTKKSGKTEVTQSDFEFDLALPKKFFGDEVGLTTAEAYKRDSTFWNKIRPQPLNKDEQRVVKEKERLDALHSSKAYLDSIDRIFNKITFAKLTYQGIGYINRAKKTTWSFEPILSMIDPLSIGGIRARYGVGYYKRFENRKQVWVNTNISYGITNKDWIGNLRLGYYYNPLRNSIVNLSLNSGFGTINGAATLNDVLRRNNFYKSRNISIRHRTELFNGFYLSAQGFYEIRTDLSGLKFSGLGDKIFINNVPQPFPTSNTYKTLVGIDYTPRQLYLREPNEKIILGSKYPTFSFDITRAWPSKDKLTNEFTLVELAIKQTFNVGVFGTSEYRVSASKFLDTTRLAVMDYKYMRGGDNYFFSPSMYTYQLIPRTFAVFDWYFESHYLHQFNGYFTSKIPLLNKTKIREVAGAGFLYVPERNYQYSEVFGGINRVFRIGRNYIRLGAYYVVAQSNTFGLRNGFKFSFEPYDQSRNTWSF